MPDLKEWEYRGYRVVPAGAESECNWKVLNLMGKIYCKTKKTARKTIDSLRGGRFE